MAGRPTTCIGGPDTKISDLGNAVMRSFKTLIQLDQRYRNLKCLECGEMLSSPDHVSLWQCCGVMTICRQSLLLHYRRKHRVKRLITKSKHASMKEETNMKNSFMLCSCGSFSSENAKKMAQHMAQCTAGNQLCKIIHFDTLTSYTIDVKEEQTVPNMTFNVVENWSEAASLMNCPTENIQSLAAVPNKNKSSSSPAAIKIPASQQNPGQVHNVAMASSENVETTIKKEDLLSLTAALNENLPSSLSASTEDSASGKNTGQVHDVAMATSDNVETIFKTEDFLSLATALKEKLPSSSSAATEGSTSGQNLGQVHNVVMVTSDGTITKQESDIERCSDIHPNIEIVKTMEGVSIRIKEEPKDTYELNCFNVQDKGNHDVGTDINLHLPSVVKSEESINPFSNESPQGLAESQSHSDLHRGSIHLGSHSFNVRQEDVQNIAQAQGLGIQPVNLNTQPTLPVLHLVPEVLSDGSIQLILKLPDTTTNSGRLVNVSTVSGNAIPQLSTVSQNTFPQISTMSQNTSTVSQNTILPSVVQAAKPIASFIPTVVQAAMKPNFPTAYQVAAKPNFPTDYQVAPKPTLPTAVQAAGKPSLPSVVQSASKLDLQTVVQAAAKPNLPTIVQETGKPGLQSFFQAAAKPNLPTIVQETGKPRLQSFVQAAVKPNISTTAQTEGNETDQSPIKGSIVKVPGSVGQQTSTPKFVTLNALQNLLPQQQISTGKRQKVPQNVKNVSPTIGKSQIVIPTQKGKITVLTDKGPIVIQTQRCKIANQSELTQLGRLVLPTQISKDGISSEQIKSTRKNDLEGDCLGKNQMPLSVSHSIPSTSNTQSEQIMESEIIKYGGMSKSHPNDFQRSPTLSDSTTATDTQCQQMLKNGKTPDRKSSNSDTQIATSTVFQTTQTSSSNTTTKGQPQQKSQSRKRKYEVFCSRLQAKTSTDLQMSNSMLQVTPSTYVQINPMPLVNSATSDAQPKQNKQDRKNAITLQTVISEFAETCGKTAGEAYQMNEKDYLDQSFPGFKIKDFIDKSSTVVCPQKTKPKEILILSAAINTKLFNQLVENITPAVKFANFLYLKLPDILSIEPVFIYCSSQFQIWDCFFSNQKKLVWPCAEELQKSDKRDDGYLLRALRYPTLKTFLTPDKLREKNVGEGNVECNICSRKFQLKWELNVHVQHVHRGKLPEKIKDGSLEVKPGTTIWESDPGIDIEYDNLKEIAEFIVPLSPNGKLQCKFCPKSFWNSSYLRDHITISHMLKEYSPINQALFSTSEIVYFDKVANAIYPMNENSNSIMEDQIMCLYEPSSRVQVLGDTSKLIPVKRVVALLGSVISNKNVLLYRIYTSAWKCAMCNMTFERRQLHIHLEAHECSPEADVLFICPDGDDIPLSLNLEKKCEEKTGRETSDSTDGLTRCENCHVSLSSSQFSGYKQCLRCLRFKIVCPVPSCKYKFFENHETLMKHLNHFHTTRLRLLENFRTYNCPICAFCTEDALLLQNHLKTDHPAYEVGDKSITCICLICSYSCFDPFELGDHIKRKHEDFKPEKKKNSDGSKVKKTKCYQKTQEQKDRVGMLREREFQTVISCVTPWKKTEAKIIHMNEQEYFSTSFPGCHIDFLLYKGSTVTFPQKFQPRNIQSREVTLKRDLYDLLVQNIIATVKDQNVLYKTWEGMLVIEPVFLYCSSQFQIWDCLFSNQKRPDWLSASEVLKTDTRDDGYVLQALDYPVPKSFLELNKMPRVDMTGVFECYQCCRKFDVQSELELHQKYVHFRKLLEKNADGNLEVKAGDIIWDSDPDMVIDDEEEVVVPLRADGKLQCKFCCKSFWHSSYLRNHIAMSHMFKQYSPADLTWVTNEEIIYFDTVANAIFPMDQSAEKSIMEDQIMCLYEPSSRVQGSENTVKLHPVKRVILLLQNVLANKIVFLKWVYTISWKCAICNKPFVKTQLHDQLEAHKCSLKAEVLFICPIDDSVFLSLSQAEPLMQTYTEVNLEPPKTPLIRCRKCKCNFSGLADYIKHMRVQHGVDEGNTCPVKSCGENFDSYKDWMNHINHYHYNGVELPQSLEQKIWTYNCPFCYVGMDRISQLQLHLKSHHPKYLAKGTVSTCRICGFNCKDPLELAGHIKNKHKVIQIAKCQDKIQNKIIAVDGQKEAEEIESLQKMGLRKIPSDKLLMNLTCPLCFNAFQNAQLLQNHLHSKHAGQERTKLEYKCDICVRKYFESDPFALEKHMISHHYYKLLKMNAKIQIGSCSRLEDCTEAIQQSANENLSSASACPGGKQQVANGNVSTSTGQHVNNENLSTITNLDEKQQVTNENLSTTSSGLDGKLQMTNEYFSTTSTGLDGKKQVINEDLTTTSTYLDGKQQVNSGNHGNDNLTTSSTGLDGKQQLTNEDLSISTSLDGKQQVTNENLSTTSSCSDGKLQVTNGDFSIISTGLDGKQQVTNEYLSTTSIPGGLEQVTKRKQEDSLSCMDKEELFSCYLCMAKLHEYTEVFPHMILYHTSDPQSCRFCEDVFCGSFQHFCCGLNEKRFISRKNLRKNKVIIALLNRQESNIDGKEVNMILCLCKICKESFQNAQDLFLHSMLKHGNGPRSCRFCERIFSYDCFHTCREKYERKYLFRKNYWLHKEIFPSNSNALNSDSRITKSLEHFMKRKEEEMGTLSTSDRDSTSRKDSVHTNKELEAKSYSALGIKFEKQLGHTSLITQCQICQANYKVSNLRTHLILVHSHYPTVCAECGILFAGNPRQICETTDKLITRTDSQKKIQVRCPLCKASFYHDSYFYVNHIMRKHKDMALCCRFCESIFVGNHFCSEKERIRNRKDVMGFCKMNEKCLRCLFYKSLCRKSTPMQACWEKSCEYCQSFTKCNGLRCPQCTFVAHNTTNLTHHAKTHGENKELMERLKKKEYICDMCGKIFTRLGTFKYHQTIHCRKAQPGLEVYQKIKCLKCPKYFFKKRYLKMHVKNVHETKRPYTCVICDFKFYLKSTLQKHLNQHYDSD